MLRKLLVFAVLLAAGCGGGIKHTKVTQATAVDLNAQGLAKVGRITSLRENGGMLFIGAEKGLAAVDGAGKVLWTLELPTVAARLVEADADGIAFTSFNPSGVVEGSPLAHFLVGDIGDDPHFTDQIVGAATRDGKLLFTAPAAKGITQMSPPGLSKDEIGISRGRGIFVYSRADGHEIGHSMLVEPGLLSDMFVLNGSFNRPAFLGGFWYVSHLGDFLKVDVKGEEKDRTRRWGLLTPLANLTIGPVLYKDRLVCGTSPIDTKEKPTVYAFDNEGGKDWKEAIDDTVSTGFMSTGTSGVGAITANSQSLFVATNFRVIALNEKGSRKWERFNKGGGLYPSKYRGLRYTRNYGARRSQGQLIVADENNVYVATNLSKTSDALTVLNAQSGEYQGSLDVGAYIVDMAFIGGKIALATEDGLKLVSPL